MARLTPKQTPADLAMIKLILFLKKRSCTPECQLKQFGTQA